MELEAYVESQDANMELRHSSSWNSEVDLVKGKHANTGITHIYIYKLV